MIYLRTKNKSVACYYTDGSQRYIIKGSPNGATSLTFGVITTTNYDLFTDQMKRSNEEISYDEFWNEIKKIEQELMKFQEEVSIFQQEIPEDMKERFLESTTHQYKESY